MTKKQKASVASRLSHSENVMHFLNRNPARYITVEDAAKKVNPIPPGDVRYESAPFEVGYIPFRQ